MNKDEEKKDNFVMTTERLKDIFSNSANAFKKLQEALSKRINIPVEGPPISKHRESNNHNKKRNKVRAKMAANSNRINRKRIKKWKY